MALTLPLPATAPTTATVAGSRVARTTARIALNIAVVAGVALFAFLAIGPRLLPYQTVTMLTGSMSPAIPPGSVAIDVSESVSALRPGQIISFHAPVPGKPVVTHRVIDVRRVEGQVLVRTRGDANAGADPWTAVVHGAKVWRVRAVVPHLGTALRRLRGPNMHLLMGFLAPAGLLCWFLAGVWRRPKGGHRGCVPAASPAFPSSCAQQSSAAAPLPSPSSKATQRPLSH